MNQEKTIPPKKKQTFGKGISEWYDNLSGFTKLIVFSLLIPAIIASSFSFIGAQYTTFKEEKYIAQGMLVDIKWVESQSKDYVSQWNGYESDLTKDPANATQPATPINPFYSESGAYFLYGKDIYRLGPDLSTMLNDCYEHVISAEDDRKEFVQRFAGKDYGLLPSYEQINYQRYNNQMGANIVSCWMQIPEIEELLGQKQNSTFLFFFS